MVQFFRMVCFTQMICHLPRILTVLEKNVHFPASKSPVPPNCSPVWHISLMYFLFFLSKSQNFPARNFLICLFFPGLDLDFQILFVLVKPFGYTKRLCTGILQLRIAYCISLIMVTITSHVFINIFQKEFFQV